MGMPKSRKREKEGYKPMVYICAPYSGDVENNIKQAMDCAEYAYWQGTIPMTPHFMFPFLNDEEDREDILKMDIVLLGNCDEIWVFGDTITEGMQREIEVAQRRQMKTRYIKVGAEE